MPDTRTHRGAAPGDDELFSPEQMRILAAALDDYCLLLSRGYAQPSALKLVGDRFGLNKRQRLAVMRSACSDEQAASRRERQISLDECKGKAIAIDGYNLLITVEAALSGGPIFLGRDGCVRDISGIHGTYRKVEETIPAVELIGAFMEERGIGPAQWYFDSPVSNSGRLKVLLAEISQRRGWRWGIELSINPDKILITTDMPVASSDSVVLDACRRWVNLGTEIIGTRVKGARVLAF